MDELEPTAEIEAAVLRVLDRLARPSEPQLRARWVTSTRREANEVLLNAGVYDDAPVVAVEITGPGRTFRSARGGPRGHGHVGSPVLTLVMELPSFRVVDRGYSPRRHDLSRLGEVHVLPAGGG